MIQQQATLRNHIRDMNKDAPFSPLKGATITVFLKQYRNGEIVTGSSLATMVYFGETLNFDVRYEELVLPRH